MTASVGDFGPASPIEYPRDDYNLNLPDADGVVQPAVRLVFHVGNVNLRNIDFANPQTGRGLVWDVWAPDTTYRGLDHGCNVFRT